jgi:hypothetical protein
MTTTAGHSFYIGSIGFFYYQVNDTYAHFTEKCTYWIKCWNMITYSFIGSLSSKGPTFSKNSYMLTWRTCRLRQLEIKMKTLSCKLINLFLYKLLLDIQKNYLQDKLTIIFLIYK